ncbi:MAG: hypothetical protein ACLR3C_05540 [Eggerthella lenta]
MKERGCKFVIVDPRITPTVMGLAASTCSCVRLRRRAYSVHQHPHP